MRRTCCFILSTKGIATLLTHLAARDEGRSSGSPGCHPQGGGGLAGVSEESDPLSGNRRLQWCGYSAQICIPWESSRPALHLSPLSLRETPQCPVQHWGLLMGLRQGAPHPRQGVHLQPGLLSPSPLRPVRLSPPKSCPKPSSTGSCFSVPATAPVESQPWCGHWLWTLKPSPAQQTTKLNFI